MAVFPKSVNLYTQTPCLWIIYHLKAIDQLISKVTSAAMKDVVILRKIILKHKNEKLKKCANHLLMSHVYTVPCFEALSVQFNMTYLLHPMCISKMKLKNCRGDQPHPRLERVTILWLQWVDFYLWQKFVESHQIFTKLWHCVPIGTRRV